ncbi:MAG: hypothetical protein K6G32_11215, partial [Prevotella sp.]|nr:hypothetical protein [Prevotella sp.]
YSKGQNITTCPLDRALTTSLKMMNLSWSIGMAKTDTPTSMPTTIGIDTSHQSSWHLSSVVP